MSSQAKVDFVTAALTAAVNAVMPAQLLSKYVKFADFQREGGKLRAVSIGTQVFFPEAVGKIVVIGTGKASADMAYGLEQALKALGNEGALLFGKIIGVVNVPNGIERRCEKIQIRNVREQGVNAPTDRVLRYTDHQLTLLKNLGPNDIVIDLISGGGSATRELLCSPLELKDLAVIAQMQNAGANINQMNAVRKHCSQVKGGKMCLLTQNAKSVIAFILSDVVGDPLDVIASGPYAENTASPSDALGYLRQFGVNSGPVLDYLTTLASQAWAPIRTGENVKQLIIGSNAIALTALMREFGSEATVLSHGSTNTGDAREAGRMLITPADSEVQCGIEIFGGETKVTLPPNRDSSFRGGRCQRIVLSAVETAWENGLGNKVIFAVGTDGEDGKGGAAGAIVSQEMIDRAKSAGLTLVQVQQALADGNEYPILEQMGALVITGPSGTNVCDLWGFYAFNPS